MNTLSDRIIGLLQNESGLTDREITDALDGHSAPQQPVNQMCHRLKNKGVLIRRQRTDGLIGNYLASNVTPNTPNPHAQPNQKAIVGQLSEDRVKKFIEKWLTQQRWHVEVSWGHRQGIDIDARQRNKRWVIEVKGEGSLSAMRVNYFLSALGELLQRMDDPNAQYSIAFPDLQQFHNLWTRFPDLAKSRTGISVLFIDENGQITHLH